LGCFPLDNEPYHPLSDSQDKVIGIRSLTEFGNPIRAPSPISALPPILLRLEASPKAISERTSYLRVRLAFHPYPHLIPAFFQHTWVRASSQCYLTFTLDMGRSHGFGSTTAY